MWKKIGARPRDREPPSATHRRRQPWERHAQNTWGFRESLGFSQAWMLCALPGVGDDAETDAGAIVLVSETIGTLRDGEPPGSTHRRGQRTARFSLSAKFSALVGRLCFFYATAMATNLSVS